MKRKMKEREPLFNVAEVQAGFEMLRQQQAGTGSGNSGSSCKILVELGWFCMKHRKKLWAYACFHPNAAQPTESE